MPPASLWLEVTIAELDGLQPQRFPPLTVDASSWLKKRFDTKSKEKGKRKSMLISIWSSSLWNSQQSRWRLWASPGRGCYSPLCFGKSNNNWTLILTSMPHRDKLKIIKNNVSDNINDEFCTAKWEVFISSSISLCGWLLICCNWCLTKWTLWCSWESSGEYFSNRALRVKCRVISCRMSHGWPEMSSPALG